MSLDNLPVEWLLTELNQVLSVKNGYAFKSKDYISEKTSDDLVPVIRISDIKDNSVSTLKSVFVEKAKASENFKIDKGDLLIAMSGATTGKTGIFREENPAFLNQRVGNLKVHSQEYFLPKFRNFLIQNLSNQILENAYGGAQPNISSKDIESLKFGLPPLAEQQEIVRQLDVMLAQVEQIKVRLDAIPAILKKFRQSVLADAVSGKLTEKERGTTSIKSGIPAITLGKQYAESPKGWIWSNLTELAALESGHTPRKSVAEYWDGGDVPWISLQDIREAHGKVINDTKFMPTMKGIDNSSARLLPKGTVCFSRDISVGYTTIMGREMATTQHFANWVCNKELLNNFYLMYAYMASKDSLLLSGQGTTVKTIYMPALKTSMILLPPLEEQELIVTKIQNFFRMSELIESQISAVQKRVNVLTQSILAKAFSGELTAEWRVQHQDLITGVNSAESLLAKIQEEREASKPVKKVKKVK